MDSHGSRPRNGQHIPSPPPESPQTQQMEHPGESSAGQFNETMEELTRMRLAARPLTPEPGPNDFLPGLPSRRYANKATTQPQPPSPGSPGKTHARTSSRPLLFRSFSGEEDDVFAKEKEASSTRPRRRTVDEGSAAGPASSRKLQKRSRGASMQDGGPAIPPRRGSGKGTSQVPVTEESGRDLFAWPTPGDARRTLHLMGATRGRMHGALYFREGTEGTWYVAHCFIDHEAGSLLCETSYGRTAGAHLVPDLRGLEVLASVDVGQQSRIISVQTADLSAPLQLRPLDTSCFDRWFAALLCWSALPPKGKLKNGFRQSIPAPLLEAPSTSSRFSVDGGSSKKDGAVVKIGRLSFWDTGGTEATLQAYDPRSHVEAWIGVSCILYQNGTLKIFDDSHSTSIARLKLAKMSRSTIQRLDPSVLGADYCLAIYPQYAVSSGASSRLRPIYLSIECRATYESWFVLLRAFAVPEIYGPPRALSGNSLHSDELLPGLSPELSPSLFRLERSLRINIGDAKLQEHIPPPEHGQEYRKDRKSSQRTPDGTEYYVQVLLDGQPRAKTSTKASTGHLFWFENFEIQDLGAVMPCVTVQVLRLDGRPGSKEDSHANIILSPQTQKAASGQATAADEGSGTLVGEATFEVRSRARVAAEEQQYPLIDSAGNEVGSVRLKFKADIEVMLMDAEYQQLSELLHNFSNVLTISIAERLPTENNELFSRYCDTLLNIFQASNKATDWLMSLAEEEVDGVRKETPASHMRYAQKPNDSDTSMLGYLSPAAREASVRGMGKFATTEANLLFRGNTLLSKSLDAHMKRVGKEYLEETIGLEMRTIADVDPDCEVDPNKLAPNASLDRNWRRLITLTQKVWTSIAASASRCPLELRAVFRHIRACAEDRYGDFLRTVTYSSVSGFLFLRFFCPAVLNPKLFGLIKTNPRSRAARTFLLIAKSLQNLANLTTSGAKEPWMERMNEFLTSQRQPFKNFIDELCAVPSTQTTSNEPTHQYSTPLAIFSRLPATHKEGFPSLPYLIDHARDFSALVNLWLDNVSNDSSTISLSATTSKQASTSGHLTGDLLRFHTLCLHLRTRALGSFEKAERTERRSSTLVQKWVTLAERMESKPTSFWVPQLRAHAGIAQQQMELLATSKEHGDASAMSGVETPDALEQGELNILMHQKDDNEERQRQKKRAAKRRSASFHAITTFAGQVQDAETDKDMTALPSPVPQHHHQEWLYIDESDDHRFTSTGAPSLEESPLNSSSDAEQQYSGNASAAEAGVTPQHQRRKKRIDVARPRSKGKTREKDREASGEKDKGKFGLFGRKKRSS